MSSALLSIFDAADTIVLKIGSALLVDRENLRKTWLESMADDLQQLRDRGKRIVLVSSGAIALGRSALGLTDRPGKLEEAQAAAAVGQIKLAEAYQQVFAPHGIRVAQVLLTLDDLEDRRRYINARNTVTTLLDHDIIPVINENDTVATSEIRFGDNDRLAARVAQMAGAQFLLLLSDIDGLYTADPRLDMQAEFLAEVSEITPAVQAMAGPPAVGTLESGNMGSGGMITKIDAARIALSAGCNMAIVNGTESNPVERLIRGERATLFRAKSDPLSVRKQWISGMMAPKGFLHLDAGAVRALRDGASLLPAGVTRTDGTYTRGDLIALMDEKGDVIGQGLASYASDETEKMQGKAMKDALTILGYAGRSALVHRDDLIML